jgi:glutaredoxin 3
MKLELYKKETCRFCHKVMGYIDECGRTDVEYKDVISDPENMKTLVEKGGMRQVPCLFIDGSPMYESGDIIEWLSEHPQEGSKELSADRIGEFTAESGGCEDGACKVNFDVVD